MALWPPKVEGGVRKASEGASLGAGTGLQSGNRQPGDLTRRRGAPAPPHGAFQPAGSCRGHTSPPGTTARTTRLGGTETGWRLNRKWERGFQKRRQQIINLLINSSGPVGGKGLSHCRAEAGGGGGLKPLASSRSQLVIPKCQMQGTAGPAGSVSRPAPQPEPRTAGHWGVRAGDGDAAQTSPYAAGVTHTGRLQRRGRKERPCLRKVLSPGNPTKGGRQAGRGPSGGGE